MCHVEYATPALTEGIFLRTRSRYLKHPLGARLKTPILIPSFSSKGFDLPQFREGKQGYSEVSRYLHIFGPSLTEIFLISGYDIHHDLLERARSLTSPQHFGNSVWATPHILFLDSGLYEFRLRSDSEEAVQEMRLPQDWCEKDYVALVDRLPHWAPIAVVNWDRYGPYGDQVVAAQTFFAAHKNFLSVFLLKPEHQGSFHDLVQLGAQATRLSAFDVIGVAEKELGDSVLERMGAVAQLHDLLIRAGVDAPIHIFGALDPLYTPLYFAAGAEIFDGLSWLRYFWQNGVAVHRASLSVLMRIPEKEHGRAIEIAQSENLDRMAQLRRRLINFHKEGGDWSVFSGQKEVLEDAFRDMESTLEGN